MTNPRSIAPNTKVRVLDHPRHIEFKAGDVVYVTGFNPTYIDRDGNNDMLVVSEVEGDFHGDFIFAWELVDEPTDAGRNKYGLTDENINALVVALREAGQEHGVLSETNTVLSDLGLDLVKVEPKKITIEVEYEGDVSSFDEAKLSYDGVKIVSAKVVNNV